MSKLYSMGQFSYPPIEQKSIDIDKLQTGEADSFRQLYLLFFDELVASAKCILVNKDVVPAVVNHCFIKCWIRSDELTSVNYIRGYLRCAVRQSCLSYNQNKIVRTTDQDKIIKTILCFDVVKNVTYVQLFALAGTLTKEKLTRAREVFDQFYTKGCGVEEIATEMNVSPKHIQVSLNHGLLVLHLAFIREII